MTYRLELYGWQMWFQQKELEQSEIDMLSNKHRDIAEHYGRRFMDYMSFNTNKYPEYFSNNNDDMQPQKDAYYGGWNI